MFLGYMFDNTVCFDESLHQRTKRIIKIFWLSILMDFLKLFVGGLHSYTRLFFSVHKNEWYSVLYWNEESTLIDLCVQKTEWYPLLLLK